MKILIIKLGYSETLDSEVGRVVSLGDVVRCTCVLEALHQKYKNANISWLVAPEAYPLVAENPLINRIIIWDEFVGFALMRESFDMVVNLEKIDGICALADMINAWEKVGFRFNPQSGSADAYSRGMNALDYIRQKGEINPKHEIWQKIIIEACGCEWREQGYSLGYKPKTSEKFQVGLNFAVGSKWPTKAMARPRWDELAELLEQKGISYSFQRGMNDLYEYMDWISCSSVLISNDSLGVHLALALGKCVITLCGSTSGDELYFYNRGCAVYPNIPKELLDEFSCMPCYLQKCPKSRHCMDFIDLESVVNLCEKYLNK